MHVNCAHRFIRTGCRVTSSLSSRLSNAIRCAGRGTRGLTRASTSLASCSRSALSTRLCATGLQPPRLTTRSCLSRCPTSRYSAANTVERCSTHSGVPSSLSLKYRTSIGHSLTFQLHSVNARVIQKETGLIYFLKDYRACLESSLLNFYKRFYFLSLSMIEI